MPVTIRGKEYEEVKERIEVFYKRYEDGRIITEILSEGDNHVTILASIYSDREEQLNQCPLATGIAREERGGEISKYTENAETSAIGRAFANREIYTRTTFTQRPSAEEMSSVVEKSQEVENTFVAQQAPVGNYDSGEVASAEAFGETPQEASPICEKCGGVMVKRTRKADGKEFWGCSNWSPTGGCNGVQEVETSLT
mgnify:CR=1 FL=1|tara:strand:- start:891 stop:1484 length:594 start_codon:yes stop_codon:yes gene_type:complete